MESALPATGRGAHLLSPPCRRALSVAWRFLLFVALYVAAGRVGRAVDFVSEDIRVLWPQAGVALGCLLVFGVGYWPAIIAGSLMVTLSAHLDPWLAMGFAFGNALGAGCCRRSAAPPPALRSGLGLHPRCVRVPRLGRGSGPRSEREHGRSCVLLALVGIACSRDARSLALGRMALAAPLVRPRDQRAHRGASADHGG